MKKDLTLYRGDAATPLKLNFNGQLEEGDKVRMMVRADEDSEAVITKEYEPYSEQEVFISFENADTQELEAGKYIYDIEWVRSGEPITIIRESKITLKGDVTHD